MKRILSFALGIVLAFTILGQCTELFGNIDPYRTIDPLSPKNDSKTILILGNSFVGTSQIGAFLKSMLDAAESDYSVEAVSRGYATVATYSSDTNLMSRIEDGEYCYVFQCGFYTVGDPDQFSLMREACMVSNTGIAVFPAHNENTTFISRADSDNMLDWQGEISALLAAGVEYDDMCFNDMHAHSTPLAGYVGAHMIYRNLFGKLPPDLTDDAPLDMEYIEAKLGSYVTTGKAENL